MKGSVTTHTHTHQCKVDILPPQRPLHVLTASSDHQGKVIAAYISRWDEFRADKARKEIGTKGGGETSQQTVQYGNRVAKHGIRSNTYTYKQLRHQINTWKANLLCQSAKITMIKLKSSLKKRNKGKGPRYPVDKREDCSKVRPVCKNNNILAQVSPKMSIRVDVFEPNLDSSLHKWHYSALFLAHNRKTKEGDKRTHMRGRWSGRQAAAGLTPT